MLKLFLSSSLLEQKKEKKTEKTTFVLIQPNVVFSILFEQKEFFFLKGTKRFCQKEKKVFYVVKDLMQHETEGTVGILNSPNKENFGVDSNILLQEYLVLKIVLNETQPFILVDLVFVEIKKDSICKTRPDYKIGFEEKEVCQKLYKENIPAVVFNQEELEMYKEIEEYLSSILKSKEDCFKKTDCFSVDGGKCKETNEERSKRLFEEIRSQLESIRKHSERLIPKIEEIDQNLL